MFDCLLVGELGGWFLVIRVDEFFHMVHELIILAVDFVYVRLICLSHARHKLKTFGSYGGHVYAT